MNPQQPRGDASTFHPLYMRRVTNQLGVSVRALARRLQLGIGTLHALMATGNWPKRRSVPVLKAEITEALREAGAGEDDLKRLFDHYNPHDYRHDAKDRQSLTVTPEEEEETMLMPKQTLTPEARKAFGLFVNPFDGEVTSAEEMFQNGEIRYVREACWQTAINARFTAVVGESGAGKTTLLGDLKERILADNRPVIVIEPSVLGMEDNDRSGKTLKSSDIQTALVMTLDPLANVAQTSEKRTRQVQRLLEHSTSAGHAHLLIIEEAHGLPLPTLKHLKRLHERMRLGRKPMLGILLLGHPELSDKLRRHDAREVYQRCEEVRLQPLGGDLRSYLEHRCGVAGRKLSELIDDAGIEAIQQRLTVVPRTGVRAPAISLLYPLAVNNLMSAALNTAAALGVPRITRDVVLAV